MQLGILRLSGLGGLVSALVACSLIVDTSEITEGCGAGRKYCEGKCVSVDEPFYGCTANDCRRCPNLGEHTEVRCEGSECVSVGCVRGWGCENCSISLFTDPDNCGFCGNRCEAGELCRVGDCHDPLGAGGVGSTVVDGAGGGTDN